MITKVRGLLAAVPSGVELDGALDSISHRAWDGYISIRNKQCAVYGASYSAKNVGSGFIHGEIFSKEGYLDELAENPSSEIAEKILRKDGSFAFVIPKGKSLILGRDSMGTRPLYYARNKKLFAVASEKKALAILGLKEIKSIPPSNILAWEGGSLKKLGYYDYLLGIKENRKDSTRKILDVLQASVRSRVNGRRRIAVSFSGGVDSSLIAAMASKLAKVIAVSVSVAGSHDAGIVKQAARELGLDWMEVSVKEKEIKSKIGLVRNIAEVSSSIDISIAMGLMLTAQKASEEGCDAMLVGQLADEIFGGYRRYLKQYCSEGTKPVQESMRYDVLNAYSMNFDRDEKATSQFVDLYFPYANVELARIGLSINPDLKFDCKKDGRKIVLRQAAKKFAIPKSIAERPKKALQYSSGIYTIVKKYVKP
ncbi:MAG: asparagine synthetase B [Thaumarchaeota archaeon]|nr:asparagine synthetase B [Nitrososphaerota archaeon]